MLDTRAIAAALAPIVKAHVADATAPLIARIAELEQRQLLRGEPGEPGEPGRDGKDGVDGRDADPVSDEQIAAAVERYLIANPPAAGKDGEHGVDGRDGVDGADGKDADLEALKSHCEHLIASLPKPENGRDGVDGKDGSPGKNGNDGRDGADGVGLAGAMIDRDGEMNITLTNGEVRRLGSVIGRDGKDGVDGADGADGQSWEDMEVRRTSPRTIELSFDRGERRNTFELEFPIPLYRGVFSEGETYQPGDMVTWAGSLWHCNDASPDKPGDGAKAWTLAAKRGRDGKDFAGPQTKPGTVKI